MLSYWKLMLMGFLITVLATGMYSCAKQEDDDKDFIADQDKREFKIGDSLTNLWFPDSYHATGVLRLVTSNISEPFEIWYSKQHMKSRIDYYNGNVKTYQRGDLGKNGMFFKLVPKYSFRDKQHWFGCWKRYGVRKRKINAQSILPHDASWPFRSKLVDFKYVGDAHINGKLCTKWTYKTKVFEKRNTYEFYASKTEPPLPVSLKMNGYDTILVSYYDNYIIDYKSFNKWNYDSDKFRIPKLKHDKWCWDISKLRRHGDGANMYLNPMNEFASVDHVSDLIDRDFDDFKKEHNKVYRSYKEHLKRKKIFKHNLRYIRSINRGNRNYRLRPNHFADLTDKEFQSYKGELDDSRNDDEHDEERNDHDDDDDNEQRNDNDDNEDYNSYSRHGKTKSKAYDSTMRDYDDNVNDNRLRNQQNKDNEGGVYHTRKDYGHKSDYDREYSVDGSRRSKISNFHKEIKKHKRKEFQVPDTLDWRKYGAVNNPKGQGTCGSCWAFAASGAIEGANFIKTGKLENLSEQQLLDCTWFTPGAKKGNNGCLGGWTWKAFSWVKRFGLATTKSYGAYKGQEGYCKTTNLTIGAKIHNYRRVKHYNNIALKKALSYHGPATISINANPKTLKFYSKGVLDDISCSNKTDHAVLLIGYGKENGIPYWLVKNSWSSKWGDHGFIKIKQGLCGIEKRPFVVLNKSKKLLPWQTDKTMKKDDIITRTV